MSGKFRIGLMAPLSGVVSLYGPEIVAAATIACAEVNEQGGILGRALELIVEDDGSLPATAMSAAERLIDEHGCVALIGNLLSNARIDVAYRVAEPRRVPLLNFSFYEGSIRSPYFFHFAALPNQQIDRMIPFAARHHGLKVFFAGNNYEWPRGSIDAAKRALTELEGDVVGEAYLPLGVVADQVEALMAQLARSGADVFVPYFAGVDQIAVLTRFTELGLKQRMAVITGHFDELMASQLPPEVRAGVYVSNTYFMSVDTPLNRSYLQRLQQQQGVSGIWPDGNGVLTHFGEAAYLCVHAFATAARAAGGVSNPALIGALRRVEVSGPQGEVRMDPVTQHASVNVHLARCTRDGVFEIVEHFGCIEPRIPARYQAEIDQERGLELPSPALTARLAAEIGASRQPLESAQRILSVADMAIITTDGEGVISQCNLSAEAMFGYEAGELVGLSVHHLVPPHFRERHTALVKAFIDSEETERRMGRRNEITDYRKDGSFFPLEASIAKFHDGRGWLLVVTLRDITERKEAEATLTWQATHDTLTGLPNRALIRDRLTNALQRSRRSGLIVALLFIDLDGFKLINGAHGHAAGDELLKTVARRLIEQIRPGDTVARLGSDEFVVLCEQVEQPTSMSVLAERINDALRLAIEVDGNALYVTASIGIAVGNGTTHAPDDLLRHADTAMHAVKARSGDGWQFFSEGLEEKARQRLMISTGLRLAIERNELSLRYQPIVAAETARIVGAELLLRWHPPTGEVSPAIFIPIAELSGAIVPIGEWVLRQACRCEASWRQRWGEQAPYVSVNLSARQLGEENLPEVFAAILRDTGADPSRLLLEITETALMADVEANLRVLRRLAEFGLRVAVDDFGTGYSSLSQLTRLPVDVLKIDRAFVDGLERSEENRAVIRAVAGLGAALGLKLVAEGVENDAQRQELCACGCEMLQGYHFYRPLIEADFARHFQAQQADGGEANAPSLYYLIYVSRAQVEVGTDTLKALRQVMQRRNRLEGLSGCLLYMNGEFMQMIEGQREAVEALMRRIRQDPLHRDIRVVVEGSAARRVFVDWGMVVHDLESLPGCSLAGEDDKAASPLTFSRVADDARLCYVLITAHASGGAQRR